MLSDSLKRKLMHKKPQEVARIIQELIGEINNGSIETVESLIKRKL